MLSTQSFHALLPRFKKLALPLLLMAFLGILSGCTNSDSDDSEDSNQDTVAIGKTDPSGFQENALLIADTDLLSEETTTIEVALVDGNGTPYLTPVEIIFNATCATSSITPSSIDTVAGIASVEYTAGHCQGIDTVSATTTVEGTELTATGNVAITRPVNYSIGTFNSELTTGESVTFNISLLYSNGDHYITPTSIELASSCATSSFSSRSVTANNGIASVTYTAGNCVGEDTITISSVVNGTELVAVRNITILELVQISTSINNASLITGESTTITAMLSYSDDSPYLPIVIIHFTTSCASSSIIGTVSTSGGMAATAYVAGNCTGTDTITATADIGGILIQSTINISISAPVLNLQLGSGSGATFTLGLLQLGNINPIAQGGSTSVTATIVDGDNANSLASSFNGNVQFSSTCSQAGSAVITSPISFINGVASTTYVNNGCVGDDTVTAMVNVNGSLLLASANVISAPQNVGAIQFISAEPALIAVAGIGAPLQDTSNLTFRVLDSNGDPVPQQIVTFSLNTVIGGINLSANSGVTDNQGNVSVTAQSGTIPTPFTVTASTTDPNTGISYSTQSDNIVISSLYPDQDSFSLSFSECNPDAWAMDGVTVEVTAMAADHFNNPVPDGTAVLFRTEGGSIDGSCLTVNGACSVNWRSQDPRPFDGRATVLATMIGNESYIDLNSNGRFDDGDIMGADLAEAWLDINENGIYDTGVEEFLDFDLNGEYTYDNDLFDGVLCQHSTLCSPNTSIHVRQSGVIHMASNSNVITVDGGNGPNMNFNLPSSVSPPVAVTVTVNSATGSYPAAGTSIQVETSNGTIIGNSSFDVPSTCSSLPGQGYTTTIYLSGDDTPSVGTLTVTVTSGGVSSQQTVNVTDTTE